MSETKKIPQDQIKVGHMIYLVQTQMPNAVLTRAEPEPTLALLSQAWAAELTREAFGKVLNKSFTMEQREWTDSDKVRIDFDPETRLWEIFDQMITKEIPFLWSYLPPPPEDEPPEPDCLVFLLVRGEWLVEEIKRELTAAGDRLNEHINQGLQQTRAAAPNPFKR